MTALEQRYAGALVELVTRGKIDAGRLQSDLAEVTAMLGASAGLREILASPAVAWEKKRALIDLLAQRSQLSLLTRNLLLVVTQRGRSTHLPGIAAALRKMLLEREGVVATEVVSARALDPGERAAIERCLAEIVGHGLQANFRQDPALVGGFIARIGDRIFDASVRGRLQRLRQALLHP